MLCFSKVPCPVMLPEYKKRETTEMMQLPPLTVCQAEGRHRRHVLTGASNTWTQCSL